ncbi:MAG: hypothetical protein U9O94_08185 [Nanoarchaeota archaeon]|nr:hypothetical protein [Nanoarchaeota archaeon]
MKKTEVPKLVTSIIVVIVLAVFIVNIDNVIPSQVSNTVEKKVKQDTGSGEITSTVVADYANCFSNYGQDPIEVVFVHSNYCPHCSTMKPIIGELEDEGYGFYWAESSNSEAANIISDCFSNALSGYVPQFICPKTGQEQTGAMDKLTLQKFADSCIQ